MQPGSVSLEDLVIIAKYKIEQPELYHKLYCGWLERWGMFGRSQARCYRDGEGFEGLADDEEHVAGIAWKSEQDATVPDKERDILTAWWFGGYY